MKKGIVIIINGTSSSGKTSILHSLQDLLEEPFVDAGIDRYIWSMPARYLERPLWDEVLGQADRAGQVGHNLVRGMHRAIRSLSMAGCNVVADHVLVEPKWVVDCARLFADLPAYLVGVQCPLEELEQRESMRKNRTLGQAKLQFPVIHKYTIYDLQVDTSLLSPKDCSLQIQSRLEQPPQAFHSLRQMI